MAYAIMNEAAIQRQRKRGHDDARAGNAFGHSNENMAFAPGHDRRQASDAYFRAWEAARKGWRL